jgi:glycosyltransferase involved in cell wall biosynthesis
VFVGENHGGDYGEALTRCIAGAHAPSAIEITGFASDEVYKAWLAAADVAVQLRTESRGETSAAVFDCLGYGLPLIVNAHATFNELSDDCVIKVADDFSNNELVAALENLAGSETLRHQLGERARTGITESHAPARVAAAYRDAIETFATTHPMAGECAAIDALAAIDGVASEPSDLWLTSSALVRNRKPMRLPCLLLDVTAVSGNDLKTGIERVTRNLARELMKDSASGYRAEPVRLVDGHYRYAHDFATRLLGLPALHKVDELVDPVAGDVFLGLDWVADRVPEQVLLFQSWRDRGIAVHFMVYDLLPVLQPQFFPQGMDRMHARWLRSIASCADGLIAISETVAHELRLWLNDNPASRERDLALGYSHIGADLDGDIAMAQLAPDEELLLKQLAERPTILVVGTIEPRKGQQQVLGALDELWSREQDLNLVIVGKQGWMMEDFGQRISQHPEMGERLFWHAGISDALLKQIYKLSSVLVVASEGEGFGLPLIEAAQHCIPVIARNLPVFREVAGRHASYFESDEPKALADTISNWFTANAVGGTPDSVGMHWLSWKQSANHLAAMLRSGDAPGWLHPWLNEHNPGLVVPQEGLRLVPGQVESARFIDWGQLESWGRWTLARRPRIQMRLLDVPEQADLQLNLVANAFVTDNHPCQNFSIYANGHLLGDWTYHAQEGSDVSSTNCWIVPASCIGQSGELEFTIVQEQSMSPAMLALSADTRMLGLAVSQLSLHWNEKTPRKASVG